MSKIALMGMEFHSFHGYYAEEQSVGNTYEVDVVAEKSMQMETLNDDLDNTINYEQIYLICRDEMAIARRLIETVASSILRRMKSEVDDEANFRVCIRKKHPLLGGLVDHASIEVEA